MSNLETPTKEKTQENLTSILPFAKELPNITSSSHSWPLTTLYVANLDSDVTEIDLYEYFHSVGGIASIRVSRNPLTNASLCHAYINFYDNANGMIPF